MCKMYTNTKNTIIIFFPFNIENIRRCYLFGDFSYFDDIVKIFFITKLLDITEPKNFLSVFTPNKGKLNEEKLHIIKTWMYVELNSNILSLKKLKLQGNFTDISSFHILWINYDFKELSQCEILCPQISSAYEDANYFKYLKKKINSKTNRTKMKKFSCESQIRNIFFSLFSVTVFKLSHYSKKLLPITKYFNVALHINSVLNGFVWAVKSIKEKKKLDIKVMNFLLSVFFDMFLGILFLMWMNSKISLDSFPNLFLFTTETVVNSIKELINWLRGDPAGLKLNWAFNKVLAIFFSFHIDIWWTFIAFLKPIIQIIFQTFLRLGLLGITFQASITADLLALVSFHVYCIYAYAAKLYSIQISSLISLWRLFLGRKKNPLREKVDSCRYSPEQLFVGTLGFTILLFLLPTTLLYYIVFTCIRLLILIIEVILILIRYFNQSLPVYTTVLWILRSPKISIGIEIIPNNTSIKSDFILLTVKPVAYSWWETVNCFTPDCMIKLSRFKLSEFLTSLLNGKPIYSI